MSHPEQRDFVSRVRNKYPHMFNAKRVLEVGSYNINGTVRDFFDQCDYLGIDICNGPGVDRVCSGHELTDALGFDVVITCEMMEHNMFWKETLINMLKLLRVGGLFVMTCGTTGRGVHGTISITPINSPSAVQYGEYYGNLTEKDIREIVDVNIIFKEYGFETNTTTCDIYMWGIKRGL